MLHQLFDKQPPMRETPPMSPEVVFGLVEDLRSFGWLRSKRDRAIMLEIRHANGNIAAFSYPLLESATFNPSEGITLNFSGTTVKLVGRNLNAESRLDVRLFEGITRHRVLWIQEAEKADSAELSEADVVVDEVIQC